MQTVRLIKTGKIEVVENNVAHAMIENGEAELVHLTNKKHKKQMRDYSDKMLKDYRNK